MEKKYYKENGKYSAKEIPIAEQNKLVRVMKALIRKARRESVQVAHFYFCAYADLILHPDGRSIHIIEISDMLSLIDMQQEERKGKIYAEVPFTRKRDFEKAKEYFLKYQNDTKDDRKHNPQKYA